MRLHRLFLVLLAPLATALGPISSSILHRSSESPQSLPSLLYGGTSFDIAAPRALDSSNQHLHSSASGSDSEGYITASPAFSPDHRPSPHESGLISSAIGLTSSPRPAGFPSASKRGSRLSKLADEEKWIGDLRKQVEAHVSFIHDRLQHRGSAEVLEAFKAAIRFYWVETSAQRQGRFGEGIGEDEMQLFRDKMRERGRLARSVRKLNVWRKTRRIEARVKQENVLNNFRTTLLELLNEGARALSFQEVKVLRAELSEKTIQPDGRKEGRV